MEFSGEMGSTRETQTLRAQAQGTQPHGAQAKRTQTRLFYDLEQIGKHYRKVLEDKTGDYYERFDPYILDKRPMVKTLVHRTFQRLFPEKVPVCVQQIGSFSAAPAVW